MDKNEILGILELAKDKNGEVPMRLVRQAFDKLPELIRCKDCVRYGEPECLMAYDGKQWAEADGFCHAGERGEQDEDN